MKIKRSSAQQARSQQLRSFFAHLAIYFLVCAMLVGIDLRGGSQGETFLGLDWAFWPAMGWGIGVVLHAISLFWPPSGWERVHG